MKIVSRIVLVCIIGCLCFVCKAQEKKIGFTISAGYASKLTFDGNSFEAGNGIHLGINLYKKNTERLSWDGQLSINNTAEKFTSSNLITINALYGVRYYLSKPESVTRFFASLLGGPALRIDNGDDFTETIIDVGYSVGFYAERKRFLFGVSIDAPENLIFKLGYIF
ncbi:outer membrane beta-barrel protein [Roseivirga sp. E12]|uniref:outer membrane beta-barrel protein n=1 Tax=Roseivirga sp. E12 TaxID=2819237 RepID=UPI001ABC18F9|nr:outer membrane beta-barrel protein [Roseivirga sp. E12]MBO3697009.1 outer membrane beta-barrel protein [Roseivirga sp. E12]